MEEFMYLLKGYSMPVLIISSICIFLVGCFKTTGALKKLSKQWKTITLFSIDIVLAVAGSLIYFAISKIPITINTLSAFVPVLIACILSMYSLYENVGLKKLVASILTLISTSLKEVAKNRKDAKEKAQFEVLAQTASMVAKLLQESNSSNAEEVVKHSDDALHR